jgi:hypothetical protein
VTDEVFNRIIVEFDEIIKNKAKKASQSNVSKSGNDIFDDVARELTSMSENNNKSINGIKVFNPWFDFTLTSEGIWRKKTKITERPVWVSGYDDSTDKLFMQVSFIDERGHVCKFWCRENMRNDMKFLRGLPVKCINIKALSSYFCMAITAYLNISKEASRDR